MRAQIKEVPDTDGCEVEMRLPAGHVMNPQEEEYVLKFYCDEFGMSLIWAYIDAAKGTRFINEGLAINTSSTGGGVCELQFDTRKEKLVDVICREYHKAMEGQNESTD